MKFGNLLEAPKHFGGSCFNRAGRRKSARPISTKHSMHLILRTNSAIFNKRLKYYRMALLRLASKFQVRIYETAFNFNHVHLIIQVQSRSSYTSFVRSLTSAIVSISGQTKIFERRPFTRIVTWGRDFKNLLRYLKLNGLESDGIARPVGRKLIRIWSTDPPIC